MAKRSAIANLRLPGMPGKTTITNQLSWRPTLHEEKEASSVRGTDADTSFQQTYRKNRIRLAPARLELFSKDRL